MQSAGQLRIYLTLLRLTNRPYAYPTKQYLLDALRAQGLPYSSTTLERVRNDLKQEFGWDISYNATQRGYCLRHETDEDIGEFDQFVQLLERFERLTFFTSNGALGADQLPKLAQYLQFERSPALSGTEHLAVLWRALCAQRLVAFDYCPFAGRRDRRRVVPCLLLEDRNRWYLVAWETEDPTASLKTFGVDRIEQLTITDDCFEAATVHERAEAFRALQAQAFGVHCGPDQTVETVTLRFSPTMAPYLRTLPLHESQEEVAGGPDGSLTVQLRVALNFELEREILGYGEHVEVLAPEELRQQLAERLNTAASQYQRSEADAKRTGRAS